MKFLTTLLLMFSLATTAGCDQVRDKLGALVGKESPEHRVQDVSRLVDQAKFKEAVERAESAWESVPESLKGDLALLAARANAAQALDDRALYFLEQASRRLNLMDADLLTDAFFERLLTNADFLALIASRGGTNPESATSSANGTESLDATASVGRGGVSASAGGVSVKLPE
tara:strand:- start:2724 stop:3242 length:519 start_codon:yes stop_codon:yes gene_type:complete